jgi:predicted DNA-binding protein
MFGFFKRRKAYYGDSSTKTKKEQDELLSTFSFHQELDFSSFRNNDSAVKIKLPESIQLLLDELDNNREINRSQLVRELLFAYVYGWYSLELMYQKKEGFYWRSGVLFSRQVINDVPPEPIPHNLAPELGKNIYDLKVWLPDSLVNELEALAGKASITVSHFCREVIVGALIGRSVLSERLLATENNRGISE